MRRKAIVKTKDFEFKQIALNEDTVALIAGKPEKLFWDIPESVAGTDGKKYSVVAVSDTVVDTAGEVVEVKLPRTITQLGQMAFSCSDDLQAINVDGKNKKFASVDGVVYSKDLSALVVFPMGKCAPSFQIPASVCTIGDCAFMHCKGIFKIDVPEGVTSVGNMAFAFCYHLLEIRLPKSLESLGESPFTADVLISIIVAPQNPSFEIRDGKWLMRKQGNVVCQGFNISEKIVKVPHDVQALGSYCLAYNEVLEEIFLPKGLDVIDEAALFHCVKLKKIHIPRSLNKVNWSAFGDCPKLAPPRFPAGTQVASDAFEQTEPSWFGSEDGHNNAYVDESPF